MEFLSIHSPAFLFCDFLVWSHNIAITALFRNAVLGQCLPSERKAVEVEGLADLHCDILQDDFCTSGAAVVLGTWRGWPGDGANIASADCRYATTVLYFLCTVLHCRLTSRQLLCLHLISCAFISELESKLESWWSVLSVFSGLLMVTGVTGDYLEAICMVYVTLSL